MSVYYRGHNENELTSVILWFLHQVAQASHCQVNQANHLFKSLFTSKLHRSIEKI